jgi:epoxyqueuosine reductase
MRPDIPTEAQDPIDANWQWLQATARALGAALVGSTSLERVDRPVHLTPQERAGLTHAISLAVRLSRAVLDGLEDGPNLIYKWHYRQANVQLDKIAFLLADAIQERGYRALPIAASQTIDWQKQIGHLSHRHVAAASGLGWIGRNNLLVTPQYGAQVRLVTVLTSMPLPQGQPLPFGCGECRACLPVCPAGALGETPSEWKYEDCFRLLDSFARKRNLGLHICGLCVKACHGPQKLR